MDRYYEGISRAAVNGILCFRKENTKPEAITGWMLLEWGEECLIALILLTDCII